MTYKKSDMEFARKLTYMHEMIKDISYDDYINKKPGTKYMIITEMLRAHIKDIAQSVSNFIGEGEYTMPLTMLTIIASFGGEEALNLLEEDREAFFYKYCREYDNNIFKQILSRASQAIYFGEKEMIKEPYRIVNKICGEELATLLWEDDEAAFEKIMKNDYLVIGQFNYKETTND